MDVPTPLRRADRHVSLAAVIAVAALCFSAVNIAPARAADPPLRDVIDAETRKVWQREKIEPAPPADDAAFLRRVYLDLCGTIAGYEEAVEFLDDKDPEKRAHLVDRLLADPRYARHQADVWDMVFFGRSPPGYQTEKRGGFQSWLRRQFAENTPYDRWAAAILKAEGNSVDDGAPMYFVQYKNQPEDGVESVTQLFLGVQLQCARCHDHPFEAWTQRDFYGMAAFLARLEVVEAGKQDGVTKWAVGEKNQGEVKFTGPVTEQQPGQQGVPVAARFLHADVLQEPELPKDFKEPRNFPSGKVPPKPEFSRKDKLAEWITSPENPYFARAVANRLWAQFMGRGLVHPVDNMSPANKPSHPELLDAVTKALVERGFDLRWYIRELVNSKTYQLASTGDVEAALPRWFERARCRPLSAEELAESWRVATYYLAADKQAAERIKKDRFHPFSSGYMIRFFGEPTTGRGEFQGGLHEHLYLNNGQVTSAVSYNKGGLLDTLAASSDPWPRRVDRLYLSVLNRRPSEAERDKFVEYLSVEERPHDRLKDAIWVLMTCSEFRFNQ